MDRITFSLTNETALTMAHLARRRVDELQTELENFHESDPDRFPYWNVRQNCICILKAIRRALPPHLRTLGSRYFEGIEE